MIVANLRDLTFTMLVDLMVNDSVIVLFDDMCLTSVFSLRNSPKVDVIFVILNVHRNKAWLGCGW